MKWLRIASSFLKNSILRTFWLTKDHSHANFSNLKINLLAVNNPIYARLARTCVESFLYFHPKADVVIHCDIHTKSSLKRQFILLNLLRKGQVTFKEVEPGLDWQQHKLSLILNMSGTLELFMDCDLRWNGPIQNSNTPAILYFVSERPLKTYSGISESLPQEFQDLNSTTMKNTSVFSWSGTKIGDRGTCEIIEIWQNFLEKAKSLKKAAPDVTRVSEQIVLSLIPEIYNIPFRFLKEVDRQFDGSVCESSYFGASGGRFAIWGNTIRKSLF